MAFPVQGNLNDAAALKIHRYQINFTSAFSKKNLKGSEFFTMS